MNMYDQLCIRCKSIWFFIPFLFVFLDAEGQKNQLSGRITSDGTPLIGATVAMENSSLGTITDVNGQFVLTDIPEGEHVFHFSYVGYKAISSKIHFQKADLKVLDVNLEEDILGLEAVVVTATRNAIPAFLSPIIVNRLDDRIFERTQSISLAEGLHFSPGLRIENNCQNCGFTQLRMNGLEGPYTQILINSRPVFSALAGVYGLEMIPTNMVERVEIVRGGGSALYGGNAIAGTVNIITKDPLFNHFEYNSNLAITNFENADKSLSVNGSLVSDQLDRGITFFGFNRARNPWDANGDGLSEMTKLNNLTLGADAYWKPSERSRLSWNLLFMKEFRRGGGDFDVQPHQASLAEQLDHDINGGGISYEYYSRDNTRKISVYSSVQQTNRGSYYGSGGSILTTGSNVGLSQLQAINAYGVSKDLALAAGWQISAELDVGFSLTAGNEWVHNKVSDRMPGYNRSINQTVNTFGTYAQLQWKPVDSWTFLAGGRFDPLKIDGNYLLDKYDFNQVKQMAPFVPRFSVLKNINSRLKARISYSEGYRAPQAFNEDLHIETVGGAALFTQLDQDLKTETSRSWNASLDFNWRKGAAEGNFIVDGFHITLSDPFILSDQIE
ncbi:MAG: TonB-dependent receptor, partial [Bacteroidetes bacterium]|nr:TonB-dependent receptor [Bacteroidota bacterium]